MDHGPYPWATQDAAPPRAPLPPAPAPSNPFAPPAVPPPPPAAGQGPARAPPNSHEAMDPFHALPGAAAAARASPPRLTTPPRSPPSARERASRRTGVVRRGETYSYHLAMRLTPYVSPAPRDASRSRRASTLARVERVGSPSRRSTKKSIRFAAAPRSARRTNRTRHRPAPPSGWSSHIIGRARRRPTSRPVA